MAANTAKNTAKNITQTPAQKATTTAPELHSEAASRLKDPYEQNFMGVLRTNDTVLQDKGHGNYNIYRQLKLDGKVFDGLQKRTLALVGYEWTVETVEQTHNKAEQANRDTALLTQALKQCNFDQACKDLMEALLVGMSVLEVVWTVRDGWYVPERLIKRNPQRFVFVQTGEHQPPELRLLTPHNMLDGEPLPERKFIVHRVNAEDDNPYGNGLGAQSYWPVFFKRKGLVAWNKLIDRFGTPTPHGKHPRDASTQEKATLMAAMQAMSSDGAIMTPEGMSIELLESHLTGSITTHHDLCRYMDEWLDAVWLGKEPSATSGGAQAAAAKERSDIRLALTKGDADLLSGTLNNTLLQWICELNGWQPCHVYRQIKEEIDLKVESETDKNITDMGFTLSEEGARAKYGEYWQKQTTQAAQPAQQPNIDIAPRKPASFAEPAHAPAEKDAIDALIQQELDEWQPMMNPLLAPVRELMQRAAKQGWSAQQLLDELPAALPEMDDSALMAALLRTSFTARAGAACGIENE